MNSTQKIVKQINKKLSDKLKMKVEAENWYTTGVRENMKFINWLNGKDYGKYNN